MKILAFLATCAANTYGLAKDGRHGTERARCQAYARLAVDLIFNIRHNMSLKLKGTQVIDFLQDCRFFSRTA